MGSCKTKRGVAFDLKPSLIRLVSPSCFLHLISERGGGLSQTQVRAVDPAWATAVSLAVTSACALSSCLGAFVWYLNIKLRLESKP